MKNRDKEKYLGYLSRIVREVHENLRDMRPEPPYLEIADNKDKNGCYKNIRDVRLDDILLITNHGESDLVH